MAAGFGFNKPKGKLSGHAKAQTVKLVKDALRNDPAAKSAAWAVICDNVERDPLPYALALGIEVEHKAKPMKKMAQIFTSKGKGKADREPSKPYRVSEPKKAETLGLCRVSISPTPSNSPQALEQPDPPEVIRVRDCDQRPEHYDPITGEYFTPPAKQTPLKDSARQWVREALEAKISAGPLQSY